MDRYLYTDMSHPLEQPHNSEPNSGASPIDLILMLELNDLKGQEKMNNSSLKQAGDTKVQ